jgi:centrosomal protein CEP350
MISDWCIELDNDMCQEVDENNQPINLKIFRKRLMKPKTVDELKYRLTDEIIHKHALMNGTSRATTISRRPLTTVDELVLMEMYEEDEDWIDYNQDEYAVVVELCEMIIDQTLDEAIDEYSRSIRAIEGHSLS